MVIYVCMHLEIQNVGGDNASWITTKHKVRSDILKNYTYPSTMGTTIVLDKGSIKATPKEFLTSPVAACEVVAGGKDDRLSKYVTLTFNAMSEDPRWDITCS